MTDAVEVNFDGLVGPSHHYAGLSPGNLASALHAQSVSNPKAAALQGLEKMAWVVSQGIPQVVFPPQWRPNFPLLFNLGFTGSPQKVLEKVYKTDPRLLSMVSSASSMWAANAATVAPSSDTENGKVCITPANLVSNFHRSTEAVATENLFRYVFSDQHYFQINKPLPPASLFSDEGAANHMRIPATDFHSVQHVFVYGAQENPAQAPNHFPSRQTLDASHAVARLNCLPENNVQFFQQLPMAVDKGVFHNDVIALSHKGLLLCHQHSFVAQQQKLRELKQGLGYSLTVIEIQEQQLTLEQAVGCYLFNSQIVTCGDGQTRMLLPMECANQGAVKQLLEDHVQPQAQLAELKFMDLQQSMRNGGGPACLRLRMDLTEGELGAIQGKVLLDQERIAELKKRVDQYYPDRLTVKDLSDWGVVRGLIEAVEAIYQLLDLPQNLIPNIE